MIVIGIDISIITWGIGLVIGGGAVLTVGYRRDDARPSGADDWNARAITTVDAFVITSRQIIIVARHINRLSKHTTGAGITAIGGALISIITG